MPIQVICPGCHKRFQVSDQFAGKEGPCPQCKAKIKIPEKTEEVVVHAPEQFGPKGTGGEAVLKPIARSETRFSKVGAVLIGAVVLGVLITALVLRSHDGEVPTMILITGAIVLAPPLAMGGYTFLRNDELEPHRGRSLWLRALICGIVYACLWGIYSYIVKDYIFAGAELEVFQLIIIVPLIVAAGAFTAFASMDIDFGSGVVHFGLYLLVTVLLRLVMKMPAF